MRAGFSKLPIFKSKLRISMLQVRFHSLMLKQKTASEINIEEVIDEFRMPVSIKKRLAF